MKQRHRDRADLLLLFATYWQLGETPFRGGPGFCQEEMGHACEWETSMMLMAAPRLVGNFRTLEPVPIRPAFAPASRAWITRDRTVQGHIGYPSNASAEKGERLLTWFANGTAEFLKRVIAWNGKSWEG